MRQDGAATYYLIQHRWDQGSPWADSSLDYLLPREAHPDAAHGAGCMRRLVENAVKVTTMFGALGCLLALPVLVTLAAWELSGSVAATVFVLVASAVLAVSAFVTWVES